MTTPRVVELPKKLASIDRDTFVRDIEEPICATPETRIGNKVQPIASATARAFRHHVEFVGAAAPGELPGHHDDVRAFMGNLVTSEL